MHHNQDSIQLHPWINITKEHNLKYQINKQLSHKQSILITIVNVKPQKLSLFSNLHCSTSQALVYISPPFDVNQFSLQIAYLPYKEDKQSNCFQSVSDILKQISAITITDASCGGLHKFRQTKAILEGSKQLVIVNGRDLYQIESKEGKLELAKKVQLFLAKSNSIVPELNFNNKCININLVQHILSECLQEFQFFLNCEKNWKTLVDCVLIRYKLQNYFGSKSQLGKLNLTIQEIKYIQNEVLTKWKEENPKLEFDDQLTSRMLRKMFQENTSYLQFLVQIKDKYSKTTTANQQQYQECSKQVKRILEQNNIPSIFASFVLNQQQKDLILNENVMLKDKLSFLYQQNMEREDIIAAKNNKIVQLKDMIEEFAEKAQQMKKNTMKLIELTQLFEEEKQMNRKLNLQLESYAFITNKNAQFKIEADSKMQNLIRQRGELLFTMQQLTHENLSLMNERQNLNEQVKDLKDRLEESHLVQARALKSIQNQAEIKVRLSRYENYVKQLKQIFNCFKKVQIQKFNYILQQNYKQYEQLQQKYRCSQFEVRRNQCKIKQLQQNLHCERIKLSYFQKMFANHYQNDVIPQVSEQNSATDRSIEQTA